MESDFRWIYPAVYKAGDKLFIDYAGKKLHIIDRETGEIKPVEVFVGTLGASQYLNWYDLIEERTIADTILNRINHWAIRF